MNKNEKKEISTDSKNKFLKRAGKIALAIGGVAIAIFGSKARNGNNNA